MKLLIWESMWAQHASRFAESLAPDWEVTATSGGLDVLCHELADATALLALRMPPEALPRSAGLRAFLYPGAGLLQSDPADYPDGCPVVNVYEHEQPIAEHTMMMMLAHITGLRHSLESFSRGEWVGSGRVGGTPHGELRGLNVGILGYGRIGKAIGGLARAFGMNVASVSRSSADMSLEDLARWSDFFVVTAPLTGETKGLVDSRILALLRPEAFLINVSRAEVIEEQPLFEALRTRAIAGAALDVWYQYPVPGERGYGSRFPFHELPNVCCTPHSSAWTHGLITRRIERMCENLRRLRRGEPLVNVALTGAWRP